MSKNPEIKKGEISISERENDVSLGIYRRTVSVLGEKQITPEELIERGQGSGIISVCRKF